MGSAGNKLSKDVDRLDQDRLKRLPLVPTILSHADHRQECQLVRGHLVDSDVGEHQRHY